MRFPVLHGLDAAMKSITPTSQIDIDLIKRSRAAGVMIIIVGSAKGGCGKSTAVTNLAIGYIKEGKRVLIVDADVAQGTTSKWPRPADDPHITIITRAMTEIVHQLAQIIGDYDVVLIDTPGHEDRAMGPVMEIADLLICPTKPSQMDMAELERLIRVARAKSVPHLVVFNEATRETTREIAELRKVYARFEPFACVAVRQFQEYRRAYARGRGVLNLRGEHPAKANFQRVFAELSAATTKAHRQRASKQ